MAAVIFRVSQRLLQNNLNCVLKRNSSVAVKLFSRRHLHTSHILQDGDEIKMTPTCAKQLKKILGKDEFLRIIIEGGGCSGFQYKFEVDNCLQEDDKLFEEDGGKVAIDIDSLKLVEGSTIDYQIEMIKAGFVVMKNPNVEKGCSCGSSFSIKI